VYTPTLFFGGSSLLHLLARHPKVVGIFGLAGIVAMLIHAPFGPQVVGGAEHYVQSLESAAADVPSSGGGANMASTRSPEETLAIVEQTLQTCGQACDGLTAAAVVDDPTLLREVLVIHAADTARR
jgi:hypothetical protein